MIHSDFMLIAPLSGTSVITKYQTAEKYCIEIKTI